MTKNRFLIICLSGFLLARSPGVLGKVVAQSAPTPTPADYAPKIYKVDRCWGLEKIDVIEDKAYGITVHLWQAKEGWGGMLVYECGTIGSALNIPISPVKFNAKKGTVKFSVKWQQGNLFDAKRKKARAVQS